MKFSAENFFNNFEQTCSFLLISSYLLNESLTH